MAALAAMLCAVQLGLITPPTKEKADAAQATFTDDDLRAILITSSMPYAFKSICAAFKPPHELSQETINKYIASKLSNNPEAIARFLRLAKDEFVAIAKKEGDSLFERHKNDADPTAGACNEIVQRVGPKGTDAPGLLVEVEEKASYDLLPAIEAAMDEADTKLRQASANDLKREIVQKEAKDKLCPMAAELAKVTLWSGRVNKIQKDYRGYFITVKVGIGTKFEAEIKVKNTPENVNYLVNLDSGSTIMFKAKLTPSNDFCIGFTPSYYRLEKGQFFFDNLGTGSADKDYYTAELVK